MLTPASIPVTAGKKTASTTQKPASGLLGGWSWSSVASTGLPKKKERREMAMAAMMKYWARMTRRALTMARTATTTVVMAASTVWSTAGNTRTTDSAKPMV